VLVGGRKYRLFRSIAFDCGGECVGFRDMGMMRGVISIEGLPGGPYFPAATGDCPTFVGDSEWSPLVDGASYFAELDQLLTGLGVGDVVQISGLDVDPELDLCGLALGEHGYLALGERLATVAGSGADVRVLLAGKVAARSLPFASLAGFRDSVRHANQLREWRPAGSVTSNSVVTPLAGCVLVDYAGPLLGSNHQKVVVVSRDGQLTAFVCGIDLVADRFDSAPHDHLRLGEERWGWHDAAVRLHGPAAVRVYAVLAQRWCEAATLPRRWVVRRHPLRVNPLNPRRPAAPLPPPAAQPARESAGTAVRVLRSVPARKVDSVVPARRRSWQTLPDSGVREIHETIVQALSAAHRYVYLEDQYLMEYVGGSTEFELYPHLRDAARRGAKVILLGSGVRDPEDPGVHVRRINRDLNRDLRRKIVDRLDAEDEIDFAVYRVEHLTVHAKIILVDDEFACIGSANMFSRSMGGTDSEISTAVATSTSLVRDLRVKLWAEHLRTSVGPALRASLEDLDVALGIWRAEWRAEGTSLSMWHEPGDPAGFAPAESVLRAVWPGPESARAL
jgi:phosphatidylserine/phosphatidylglycerophosphate/cardiolipin synthase-like enzyme